MNVDFTNVAVGTTVWLAVALVLGIVISTLISIASAAGRQMQGPLHWLYWFGTTGGTVFLAGVLLYWAVRVAWHLHEGTLFTGPAG
jgi:hypothetical protein